MTQPTLPIHEARSSILAALRTGNRLVLTAPPGSGKTTQVPRMIHESGVVSGRVLVLQPRRLATRMVATRVAAEMGSPLGEIVGFQTRHESKVSARTQILFLTEGLFLRWFQSHPTLPGVGAVVLDEFHERSLAADTSLGLVKLLQQSQRPDLRLVVMSATLNAAAVSRFLGCPVVEANGRMFPVEMRYLPSRSARPPWEVAAESVRNILESTDQGHLLVFMPGAYEINRTIDACRSIVRSGGDVSFHPLHGSLPPAAQDAAVAPDDRVRKVIVSTNIAETSITIDGVRHVVDSGIAKVHRYDPRRGINVLLAEPISQASSEQRAGRAGRTAPGSCTRLWPQNEHRTRPAQDDAEIQRVDLAESLLQLKAMGIADVRAFPWLDPPEEQAMARAEALLKALHAMDEQGRLTDIGLEMAQFPVHPRVSRMLMEAKHRGCIERAALWAALISERPIVLGEVAADRREPREGEPRSDLLVMEHLFEAAGQADFHPRACESLRVHGQACREVERTRSQLMRISGEAHGNARRSAQDNRSDVTVDLIKCLLTAFPDHVALRPDEHRLDCRMTGKKRVVLDKSSVAKRPGLLLALEVRETGAGDGVKTALSIVTEMEPQWLEEIHPDRIIIRDEPQWNGQALAVEQVEEHLFDGLVYHRKARQQVDTDRAAEILVREIGGGNLKLDQWDEKVEQWILRTRLVAGWFPERGLIQYDTDDMQLVLHEIVASVRNAVRFNQVKDQPCLPAVMNALSYDDQRFVQQMAPDQIKLPRAKGGAMKVEYFPDGPPRGRAKIQELYDLEQTPRIAGGRIAIVVEILGPNYRPVQITEDLASFWANQYPILRKELSRKYPRHEWR